MTGDSSGRRLVLTVVALLLGTLAVAGGLTTVNGADGGPALPAFVVDIDFPTPSVSFDAPASNETTPTPGVSPLPVAPDTGSEDDRRSTDAGYDTHFDQ